MKAYIQVKQLGKRKCSIEKMPVDFPVAPASVQELIEAVVSWQVSEYNERLLQSEMLKYLTREEMEDKAAAGKVDFGANYNGKPAAEAEAIINALQSYEDGIFRIFLNDAEDVYKRQMYIPNPVMPTTKSATSWKIPTPMPSR